ncbi:MAG: hypothetical protein JXQ29_02845 [Planctomycetes bacterium]|nr:hypothetical protein [Planctomycetota bacterium]
MTMFGRRLLPGFEARSGLALVLGLAVLGVNCRTPAPRLFVPPAVSTKVVYYPGRPRSGVAVEPVRLLAAGGVVDVRADFYAVERAPAEGLEPLDGAIRLLVQPAGDPPFQAVAPALAGARFARGEEAERFQRELEGGGLGPVRRLASERAALVPGATAAICVVAQYARVMGADGVAAAERVEIRVERAVPAGAAGDAPETGEAIVTKGPETDERPLRTSVVVLLAVPNDHGGGDSTLGALGGDSTLGGDRTLGALEARNVGASQINVGRKSNVGKSFPGRGLSSRPLSPAVLTTAVLGVGPGLGSALALVLPAPGADAACTRLVALLRVEPVSADPDPGLAAALEACRRDLEAAAGQGAAGSAGVLPDVTAPVRNLAWRSTRRSALAFLGDFTGACLVEDVALVLDDWVLERIGTAVLDRLSAGENGELCCPADPRALGWCLQQVTGEVLCTVVRERRPPPEVEGLVARCAGEVGREPGRLGAIFERADGPEALERMLVQANLLSLEDPAPAARIRAYDWLLRRGAAPAGYDPLASRKARQEALRQAEAAAALSEGAPVAAPSHRSTAPDTGATPVGVQERGAEAPPDRRATGTARPQNPAPELQEGTLK